MSFDPITYNQLNRLKTNKPFVKTPVITSPEMGDTGVLVSATITGTVYRPLYTTDVRDVRKFQIYKIPGSFAAPDWDVEADADDLTPSPELDTDSIFRMRIKDVSINGNESKWSDTIEFSTSDLYILSPTLTVENSSGEVIETPTLTASEFEVVGSEIETHVQTDWEIRDMSDTLIWSATGTD